MVTTDENVAYDPKSREILSEDLPCIFCCLNFEDGVAENRAND